MVYSLFAAGAEGIEKGYRGRGRSNWRVTGRTMRSIMKGAEGCGGMRDKGLIVQGEKETAEQIGQMCGEGIWRRL